MSEAEGMIEQRVTHARSPREAVMILARSLDQLVDRVDALELSGTSFWDSWDDAPDPGYPRLMRERAELHEPAVEVSQTEDASDIMFRPVSEEKQARRRAFAQDRLNLPRALAGEGDEDWVEAYVKGGPLWLYFGNRELVMSYPAETRALMVADVDEESHEQAHLMSIDVLKHECEVPDVGAGERALGVGDISGSRR